MPAIAPAGPTRVCSWIRRGRFARIAAAADGRSRSSLMLRTCSVLASAVALAALLAAAPSQADVLLIERVEAARGIEMPRRGQQMSDVERRFGVPLQRHPPVGGGRPQHPPITRWDYADFSVYFEHHHVVNAVVTRASAEEIAPKPAR
jgi:hypothetical protein